ncbi:pilus assembly protein TadG-related protein [Anaeromyxobacter oryzae]|uniref:Putative Flp pilus-assembly TadG-like N-terminal domain-containing protein n=1 Tax=Anaeromyxobacter oryzae TaxID=2918170 RepID=A0ABM7WP14_9BACT|nr:pilus assembly protein TadG-related protein [Anaeromyxobacter oryzae]BDG01213.1 hypothetical protein AMOR_02090 [Anaeromyxobacter oryzae]
MRSGEHGSTGVVVAIVLVLLCGFVALSLDVGHLLAVRGELQNGADAAALAGAKRLNGTNDNFELAGARADAENYARAHPTDRYDVEPRTVELGAWVEPGHTCGEVGGIQAGATNPDGYRFCAISGTTAADAANINAVRVVAARVGAAGGAGGGEVPVVFGRLVGNSGTQEVDAEAIALSGGPCSQQSCDLPFVLRKGCIFANNQLRCGSRYFIGLSPQPEDTAGITSLNGVDAANGSLACDILRDGAQCAKRGEMINNQDGQDGMTTHCDKICPYGKGPRNVCEEIRWKADTGNGASSTCDGSLAVNADGVPLWLGQVPIVVYPGESETTCGGADHYNQSAEIVTWATVGVVSARCEPFNILPPNRVPMTKICDDEQLRLDPASKGGFCIAIQLFCDQEDPKATSVGCLWAGTSPYALRLVR